MPHLKPLLIYFLTLAIWPAVVGATTVQVHLEHTQGESGTVTADFPNGDSEIVDLKDNKAVFSLDKNQSADVAVKDYNPLLFTYKSNVTTSDSPGYRALKDFIEALGPLLPTEDAPVPTAELGALPLPEGIQEPSLGRLNLIELSKNSRSLYDKIGKLPGLINQSLDRDIGNVRLIQNEVASWNAEQISQFMIHAADELDRLRDLHIKNGKVDYHIRLVTKRSENGQEITEERIIKGELDPNRPRADLAETIPGRDDFITMAEFAWSIRYEGDKLREAARALVRLQEDMRKFGKPEKLKTIILDPKEKKKVTIKVERNATFLSHLTDDAKKHQDDHVGTYEITFLPRARYHPEFAAGVVYSFVNDPEFSIDEADDGKFTITSKSDNYSELDVAAMLNITREKDHGYGFDPFLQVGIAPNSDNLGFLLGAGFDAYKQLKLSAGVIYQKVNRLAPGLELGQLIDGPDDLKTDTEFKAGLYIQVGLSFNMTGKKK